MVGEYKNYENHSSYMRFVRIRNKIKAIKYLGGDCSNLFCCHMPKMTYHLDIHHTKGKNKTFAKLMEGSWEKLKKEIDECEAVLLCKMCHSDITYKGGGKPLNTLEELE